MKLIPNPSGGYRFLTGIAPYSSGVAALPGFEIIHVTLRQPLPYRQGFELIERYLASQDRPRQALGAIELRSPRPFTFTGFAEFNGGYQQILAEWGLLVDGQNPVARTNVAPEVSPPGEPVLHAFSYTVPSDDPGLPPTFIVAGAGEVRDGSLVAEAVIRPGETSVEAMQEKAAYVMGVMAARLAGLQVGWADVTGVDIYTVHPLHSYLASTLLIGMGPAVQRGVHWYYSRPPIAGLEFEMDMRGVRQDVWV